MSTFWKSRDAARSTAMRLRELVNMDFDKREFVLVQDREFTEFELTFLSDLAWRWLADVQHWSKWTPKQLALLDTLYRRKRTKEIA